MKRSIQSAVLATILAGATSAFAQPLADRVPATALAYVGWAGSSTIGDAYGPSHLKAIMDESKMRDLFGTYLDQVETKLSKSQPDAKEAFRVVRALGAPMWKYPTAAYFGEPDLTDIENPKFYSALMCQAGADAPALAKEMNDLIAKMGRTPVPIKAFAIDGVACLSVGYETDQMALAGNGSGRPAALQGDAGFVSALKQVSGSPVTITYVNVEGALAAIDKGVNAKSPENGVKVHAFIEASGLNGLKRYVSTGAFDGKDWVSQTFVATSSERTGLLTACTGGAIDASLMKVVPEDSTFFASGKFDPAKFVRETQTALGKTDPQLQKYFNMGLSGIQQAVGTNVLDNLLEPLGTDWVIYASPTVASPGLGGSVVINKLDDPVKMTKGLKTASVNLTNWINIAISKSGNEAGLSVHGATIKAGDTDVYYLALPIFAPSWAINDGKLYLGLYPQSVSAAIRASAKGGPSLADSAKFKAIQKRLNVSTAATYTFMDLPTTARYSQIYPTYLLIARYAGFGDLFGLTMPEPLLPPLDIILGHLEPAGSVSWADELGYHSKSIVSFPGAMLLSEQGAVSTVGAGSGAMMVSILLPSLNRARETANRVKSASNLRQMGMGVILYANDNRGKYPDEIGAIMLNQDVPPEVFINPRTSNELPADKDPTVRMQYAAEHGDYVYIGKGLKSDASAELIVAYEKPDELEDGINLLYADGHVEFQMMESALAEIAKQKKERGIE